MNKDGSKCFNLALYRNYRERKNYKLLRFCHWLNYGRSHYKLAAFNGAAGWSGGCISGSHAWQASQHTSLAPLGNVCLPVISNSSRPQYLFPTLLFQKKIWVQQSNSISETASNFYIPIANNLHSLGVVVHTIFTFSLRQLKKLLKLSF